VRFGFPISILAHIGLIAVGIYVLPSAMENRLSETPFVPVELVTLAQETNIKAAPPKPKPVDDPVETQPLAPEPELVKPKPEPEPELVPEPVSQKPEPKPEPKPKKAPLPKPKPKPKPKPPSFDLARLESKLADQREPADALEDLLDDATQERQAVGEATELTVDEVDLLRSQMYRCWRAPLDAPHPEKLVVRVRLRLSPDGNLQGAPEVINQAQIDRSGDPFWKAAASSARRAVIKCQPYKLPLEKYTNWKQTIMRFSAVEMMGN